MNANFLASLLVCAYPSRSCSNDDECLDDKSAFGELTEKAPECEYCGEPHDDLVEVDDSDPSVGYYSKLNICANCQTKRRIWRNNR